jgi:hypothetical protein
MPVQVPLLFPDSVGNRCNDIVGKVVLSWPSQVDDSCPIGWAYHAADGMREVVAFAELATPVPGNELARGVCRRIVAGENRDFLSCWLLGRVTTLRIPEPLECLNESSYGNLVRSPRRPVGLE